jgi:putative heme-binding domain-containing protein
LRSLIIVLWIVGGVALLSSSPILQGYKTDAASKQTQAEMIAAGSKLFTPTCSNGYCHGKDGVGGSAPTLRGKQFNLDYLLRVIANGISATPMPAFKNAYSAKEIEQLAAYVLWLSKVNPKAELPPLPKESGKSSNEAKTSINTDANPTKADTKTAETNPPKAEAANASATANDAAALRGDASAGQAIFFDSASQQSCRACHTFQGRGGKLAPDLTDIGSKSARQLFQLIVLPHTNIAANFAKLAVTTKDGERLVGIKREEDDEAIKIFDTGTLPPVSRTIQKTNVAKVEQLNASVMPNDYASRYTLKQLLDLITFLKSSESTPKPNVSLKDLF